MKILLRVFFTFCAFFCTELFAGNLKVNLAPAAAVSAGAQWQVDGGAWRANGVTVNGLTNATHPVACKAVTGWITPSAVNAAITNGNTTTLSITYIQAASLKITLSPTSGQWRIDSGSWQTSATTVAGLTPGAHTVDYLSVTGYASPSADTVNLTAGQATSLARSYTPLSSLKLTLAPTSGQWRVDGGAWKTSGTTVTNLTPGSHTVDYAALAGYAAPSSESVTLISGQTTTLARSYVQLASLKLTLAPTTAQWRVDAGAWNASGTTVANLAPGAHTVDYNALAGYAAPASESVTLIGGQTLALTRTYIALAKITVTLTPTSGQWRVDGGIWQTSGVTVSNLAVGSHTVSYSALTGYTAPPSESVTLASGQTLSLTRSYVKLAQVSVTLAPSSGQWNIDGGAWQSSGATVTSLALGSHMIAYSALSNYTSPASESVTLAASQSLSLSRSYVQLAQISINLVPAAGKWRANAGAWQASGASLAVMPGSYLIEYSALTDYDSPANETITLAAGGNLTAARTYTTQKPTLRINLTPSAGQWRIDAGTWQASGSQVTGLSAGTHNIAYTDLGGTYNPLPAETISLALRENATLSRIYPIKPPASLTITLDPTSAQWRVDGGAWQTSGVTVSGLAYDVPHTIEYSAVTGYTAPDSESVTIASGQNLPLARSYVQLAQISLTLTPATGQWNVDGGAWQASGATVANLAPGLHTVSYSAVTQYASPSDEEFELTSGQSLAITRNYTQLVPVSITLVPASGQWTIDSVTWYASGETAYVLPDTSFNLFYADLVDYDPPPSDGESITVPAGSSYSDTRYYISQKPTLRINLTASVNGPWGNGQWRVDGGAWQNSEATVSMLSVGSHVIDYTNIGNPFTPLPSETIMLALRENADLTRTYALKPPASLKITLDPATAQWRADGGVWKNSDAVVNLPYDVPHAVDYAPVAGYTAPTSETVMIASGQTLSLNRSYIKLAQLSITLDPTGGQWRVDNGAWQVSASTVSGITSGVHLIDYLSVSGYVSPPSETINLSTGQTLALSRSYTLLAAFYAILDPAQALWRIDGGQWNASGIGSIRYGLSIGTHTVEFSDVYGYGTPSPETVTLVSGLNPPLTRSYTPFATFGITLNPSSAQWRLVGSPGTSGWFPSGASLPFFPPGNYTIEYSDVQNFVTPPAETITLVSGINPPLTRTYGPNPAAFLVLLDPVSGQVRVDKGNWISSGNYANYLSSGIHTIEYAPIAGYDTPPNETLTLTNGVNPPFIRSYTQATFSVSLYPATAQWRFLGTSVWHASDEPPSLVPVGIQTIEFSDVFGYATPPSETVTLVRGANPPLTRTYVPLGSLVVTLNPSSAQWRMDGLAWLPSGFLGTNIPLGTHTIEYSEVTGYIAPPTETVTIISGTNPTLTRDYTPLATFSVTLNPSSAQWRMVDAVGSSPWFASGTVLPNLPLGVRTIEYAPITGYIAPPSDTVTLVSGSNPILSRSYTQLATLYVNLGTAPTDAQWRLDGGAWNYGATSLENLALGTHMIDYADVTGYITPYSETVTLVSGANTHNAGIYTPQEVPGYTLTVLPKTNGYGFSGYALNDSGMIAGLTSTPAGSMAIKYDGSTVQQLGALGGTQSTAFAINRAGVVAGEASTAGDASWHAFVYSNGTMQDLGTLGGSISHAYGINDAGTIVGYSCTNDSGPPRAFSYSSGVMQDLGTLGGTYCYANAINNSGTIVGRSGTAGDQTTHAFSYSNGVMKDLGTLGINDSEAVAINDAGVIVGDFHTSTGASYTHAFVYQNGLMTDLGIIGINSYNPSSRATGINNAGKIVGYANIETPYSETQVAFIYEHGVMKDLNNFINIPGLQLPWAQAINNLGQILTSDGTVSYLLTPDPTAGTIHVVLSNANAQWRVDGGPWRMSGCTLGSLSPGNHSIEYAALAGYEAPPAENFSVTSGGSLTLSRTYAPVTFSIVHRFSDSGNAPTTILGSDGILYCAASTGVTSGLGHIFRVNQDSTGYQELKRFGSDPSDGTEPNILIEGSDGVLYGCTKSAGGGSTTNQGTVFRLNKDGTGYALLHVFSLASQGSNPNSLIEGSDGLLYGTTNAGGSSSSGAIFKLNKSGTGFAMLTSMLGSYGTNPQAIVEGAGGILYGTARNGGSTNNGTLFKLNKDGTGLTLLKAFAGGPDGSSPRAGLLASRDGLLYGTLATGGAANFGLVFKITPIGAGYQILHNFLGGTGDGRGPETALSEDANNTLYGATLGGGVGNYGTLFKLNKISSVYAIIASFSGNTSDGGFPRQRLAISPEGMLFGSNTVGGPSGFGQIFMINTAGTFSTAVLPMGAPEGAYPRACVTMASDGMIYGTTSFGGIKKLGAVYHVNKDGTGYAVLHQFSDTTDGGFPIGFVTEGSDGFIYGTTFGSPSTYSTLYRLNKDGSAYSVIHHFDGSANGIGAWGGVIEGSDGALYGTCTGGGGVSGLGAVYRINKDGSGFAFIHAFAGGSGDGSTPNAELMQAADGRLYGTTYYGGVANLGTVFGLNRDGTGYIVLRQFTGGATDGAYPGSRLCQTTDGLLYGTTYAGTTTGLGTVYRLGPDGNGYTILKTFTGGLADGGNPSMANLVTKDGVLYSTTCVGGTFGNGTLYSINPDGTNFQILINFGAGPDDGMGPCNGLNIGSDGGLYGTTYGGAGGGTIFSLRSN